MKYENERGKKALLMKSETYEEESIGQKGAKVMKKKNKYTDTMLEYELDSLYQKELEKFIIAKYKFKVIENKVNLLKEKLMLAKKYITTN